MKIEKVDFESIERSEERNNVTDHSQDFLLMSRSKCSFHNSNLKHSLDPNVMKFGTKIGKDSIAHKNSN